MYLAYCLPLRLPVMFTAVAAAFLCDTSPPYAVDKIYTPHVVKGEVELEYFVARTFDGDPTKNDAQAHEISVSYGVTDWWMPELYGIVEKEPEGSTKFTAVEN